MPDERTHRIYPSILERAHELRHPQTPAEARVWQRVRDQQLGGFKFRRQHPIDRFVVDFYCAACALVVEIDGDSHVEQAQYDIARTECLNEHGYHVIRFANRDVFQHLDAVLDAILAECQKTNGRRDLPSS